jgi:hypothetical protein
LKIIKLSAGLTLKNFSFSEETEKGRENEKMMFRL